MRSLARLKYFLGEEAPQTAVAAQRRREGAHGGRRTLGGDCVGQGRQRLPGPQAAARCLGGCRVRESVRREAAAWGRPRPGSGSVTGASPSKRQPDRDTKEQGAGSGRRVLLRLGVGGGGGWGGLTSKGPGHRTPAGASARDPNLWFRSVLGAQGGGGRAAARTSAQHHARKLDAAPDAVRAPPPPFIPETRRSCEHLPRRPRLSREGGS